MTSVIGMKFFPLMLLYATLPSLSIQLGMQETAKEKENSCREDGGIVVQEGVVKDITGNFMEYVPKIPTVIMVVALGVLLIRILEGIVRRMLKVAKVDPTLISFVTTFVKFVCWVFLIATVFSILGFSQISLAFSGSIALVIMGVATNANSLVQDLLSGLFLLAEPDFKEGRAIRLNAVAGTIIGMDIKKTKVMDADGNIHIVPNRMFDANIFVIQDHSKEAKEKDSKTA